MSHPLRGVGTTPGVIMAMGKQSSIRREAAFHRGGSTGGYFHKPILTPREKPREEEEESGAGKVAALAVEGVKKAPAIASGAKAGMSVGAKAAPLLAGVPVVGPALAAAAPLAGGVIGGGLAAFGGDDAVKSAKKLPKNLVDLREEAAKHFGGMLT